ncbi:Elongation factor ts [Thalictrum thalictroides]|uniref:Elongation factor Ts, mitochondrial n=1 Tax=Thalictrum thalictroides TaxID=46969 RepID=A0A7J6UZX4_THATH|nr:Elongation factor ts [Thalictrum thalictroides]
MMPVIPCSTNNVTLFHGSTLVSKKSYQIRRSSLLQNSTRQILSSQYLPLPLSTSIRLTPKCRSGCLVRRGIRFHILAATGTDVAVEEPSSAIAGEDVDGTSEVPANAVETDETSSLTEEAKVNPSAQSDRARPVRKSDMPPVKNEELVPGATFTGKVRSIQPFGAFVDFGAFTDGLVHVSQLSDTFVKDVGDVVSLGQEVKVKLVEANMQTKRISLTMREDENISRQRKDSSGSSDDKSRPGRRNPKSNQKSSKFVKGQDLQGTVKNTNRAGAFISLPEGEEGFLPTSEEYNEGFESMMEGSSLQIGEEVSVRVLRITRGQVTLTMKKEEDIADSNSKVIQGVVHVATNPFARAFRENKDIAAFLDVAEKVQKATQASVVAENSGETEGEITKSLSTIPEVQESSKEPQLSVPSTVVVKDDLTSAVESDKEVEALSTSNETIVDDEASPEETEKEVVASVTSTSPVPTEPVNADENPETSGSDSSKSVEAAPETIQKEVEALSTSNETIVDDEASPEETEKEVVASVTSTSPVPTEPVNADENPETSGSDSSKSVEAAPETIQKEVEALSTSNETIVDDEASPEETEKEVVASVTSTSPVPTEPVNANENPEASGSDSSKSVEAAPETIQKEVTLEENLPSTTSTIEENTVTNGVNDDISLSNPAIVVDGDQSLSSESVNSKEVQERPADDTVVKDESQDHIPSTIVNEVPSPTQNEDVKVESIPEKNGSVSNPEDSPTKASISPALVKALREETGAGMMDCKKALAETEGDLVKAQEFLRKKGLASADKKASRVTAEGRIGSYIHDSRIGVLIEVNCETDFVSRGDIFKELVDDLAMQVAACPQVQYLVTDDVSEDIVNKEREIEMQKEDLLSKPEQIRSKIVEGRIRKRLEELALLEQPYIKNDKMVVKDWVKQTIATIGENIKVKRFVRYNLGEGLEKKSQDFAAEVAAQTAAKASPVAQPVKVETKESDDRPPAVAISAALVKQLRDETGAGMMDCKKALAETGGDLEKAQEYLRKKGLSSADKKSSRLAAEGRIGSYIHDARIGVLVEVNCETDFVGRSENFKELVDDLAMQVVACPLVKFVSIEDIPESIRQKEKELEMQREDLQSKPENIREKIVEGRISKRLGELALLEQPFIKNDSLLVKDLVKQTVAAIGENIKVRRFVRFTLGEMTEDAKVTSEV